MFRIYFPIQKVIMIDLQAVSIIGVQIGYNGIGFLVNFEKMACMLQVWYCHAIIAFFPEILL